MFIETVRQSAAVPARPSDKMRNRVNRIFSTAMLGAAFSAIALIAAPHVASAHGIAGKRFFPATLGTDDPFVADEAALPTFTYSQPTGSPQSNEYDFQGEIFKTIFPDFGIGATETYKVIQTNGLKTQRGWDNLGLSAKYQVYKSDPHEMIFSVGLDADIGGTGAQRVGAEGFNTFTPQFFFGKGLGDLPDSMKWLKPLAITGVLGLAIPDKDHTTNDDGSIDRHAKVFNWGFAIQYSIPYLQSQVEDVGIGAPFNRMIPIVEFPFSNPVEWTGEGQISGSINPGVLWAGQTIQIGIEAVIPVNQRTARGPGLIAQLHFYMDDLFPSVFGKPVSELLFAK